MRRIVACWLAVGLAAGDLAGCGDATVSGGADGFGGDVAADAPGTGDGANAHAEDGLGLPVAGLDGQGGSKDVGPSGGGGDAGPRTDGMAAPDGAAPPPCAEGAACDDGNPCTTGDTCVGGACVGTPVDCEDGVDCTVDSCDADGACVHAVAPGWCFVDGACYEEGSPNPDEPCLACLPSASPTEWTADDAAGCSDGDACTTGDHCHDGACVPGVARACDDGNPCTADGCDPAVGCTASPVEGPCDDGNPCTLGDACIEGACAAGGQAPSCDDGNPCTDDGCDPAVGCTHAPNAAPCDDANPCTLGDQCADGSCQPGPDALPCDDANPCTDDLCTPQGGCQFPPNTAPCDDGNACTVGDTCASGGCQPGPDTLACDDGNPCTDNSCDPLTGCVLSYNTAPCDDGNACTVGDACGVGACQPGTELLDCNDGDVCTDDACLPASGCAHTFNTAPCDDGLVCTVGDTCQAGTCAGAPLQCDDGNDCTVDACTEEAGGCVHEPISDSFDCIPIIEIDTPARGATLDGPAQVAVTGSVHSGGGPIAQLTVDGNAVQVQPDGTFEIVLDAHQGLNLVDVFAADAIGNTATAVRSFYYSTSWTPIDAADPNASMVPGGLEVWLGKTAIDDGNHDPSHVDDLATVVELMAKSFDFNASIQNPVGNVGGFDIYVKDITYDPMTVALSPKQGALHLHAVIPNFKVDLDAKKKVCIFGICSTVKQSGDATASSIDLDTDLVVSVNPATGKVTVTASQTDVKINGLQVHLNGLLGGLFSFIANLFSGTIANQLAATFEQQVVDKLPPMLEQALESLQLDTALTVPAIVPGAQPVVVALHTHLDAVDFVPAGGTLSMAATATAPKAQTHEVLGSIGRAACLDPAGETFAFATAPEFQLALFDDLVNQILFGVWWGGGLSGDLDPAAFGANLPVTVTQAHIDAWLPPILTSCTDGGNLQLQIGDLEIDATVLLGPVPLDVTLFVSLAANVELVVTQGPQGPMLGVQVTDVPLARTDVVVTEESLLGFVPALRSLVEEQLVPQLIDQLAGSALGGFPIPAVDLGATGQVPAGTKLELDVQSVDRIAGRTVLVGEVK